MTLVNLWRCLLHHHKVNTGQLLDGVFWNLVQTFMFSTGWITSICCHHQIKSCIHLILRPNACKCDGIPIRFSCTVFVFIDEKSISRYAETKVICRLIYLWNNIVFEQISFGGERFTIEPEMPGTTETYGMNYLSNTERERERETERQRERDRETRRIFPRNV